MFLSISLYIFLSVLKIGQIALAAPLHTRQESSPDLTVVKVIILPSMIVYRT
jgi:hypothetical protein